MPPKPWGDHEQLPPGRERQTFYDSEYHGQKKSGAAGKKPPPPRWSYVLQDTPELIAQHLNDINKGFLVRLTALLGTTCLVGYLTYRGLSRAQESRPLAKRWYLFSQSVPVTLIEKNRQEGSDMYVYRFALPNSYDYAGYEPVSSVRIASGPVRDLSSVERWYTPISHPSERGFIEFAIKECDPGRMSARLRGLEIGDQVYLGRWMKEFRYSTHLRNGAVDLGLICSTGGASIALQLMQVIDKNPNDRTRLSVLYCHHSAKNMPFKEEYFDPFTRRNKSRIKVSYNVLSLNGKGKEDGFILGENTFLGNIDPSTVKATMPPPVTIETVQKDGEEGPSSVVHRPYLLVCGPQSMLMYLSGRASPISNFTYWQGWPHRYGGFLNDMGYKRRQVYKFGVSTHFLAIH